MIDFLVGHPSDGVRRFAFYNKVAIKTFRKASMCF